MLDTDLCLAFSHQDMPVDSSTTNCCAWVAFPTGGAQCGNKGQCCGPRTNPPTPDCGNRNNPTGPAAHDIREFGNNEAAWLTEFLTAWMQVTGNGFENLRHLETATSPVPTTAPTAVPALAPTIAPTLVPAPAPENTPVSGVQPNFLRLHSGTTFFIPIVYGIANACL